MTRTSQISPMGAESGSAALGLVRITELMRMTPGDPDILIGIVDGPVLVRLPELAEARLSGRPRDLQHECNPLGSACRHGSAVATILVGHDHQPALCPGCSAYIRPVFRDAAPGAYESPVAGLAEVAQAVVECVEAGVRVVNLSAELRGSPASGRRTLFDALDYAAKRGTIVVAAAGNDSRVGSAISHPWVVPVAAYDLAGRPALRTNLGRSVGLAGIGAPGEGLRPRVTLGEIPLTLNGTSLATCIVTGAIALLWSLRPHAPAAVVRRAVIGGRARRSITPPLMDAWAAYRWLIDQGKEDRSHAEEFRAAGWR
jgi:subtilisin family serine protease